MKQNPTQGSVDSQSGLHSFCRVKFMTFNQSILLLNTFIYKRVIQNQQARYSLKIFIIMSHLSSTSEHYIAIILNYII